MEEPATGSGKFAKGQRVVQVPFTYTQGQGTWQQYLAVPESNLLPVPDSISDADAAQLWVRSIDLSWQYSLFRLAAQQLEPKRLLMRCIVAVQLADARSTQCVSIVKTPNCIYAHYERQRIIVRGHRSDCPEEVIPHSSCNACCLIRRHDLHTLHQHLQPLYN